MLGFRLCLLIPDSVCDLHCELVFVSASPRGPPSSISCLFIYFSFLFIILTAVQELDSCIKSHCEETTRDAQLDRINARDKRYVSSSVLKFMWGLCVLLTECSRIALMIMRQNQAFHQNCSMIVKSQPTHTETHTHTRIRCLKITALQTVTRSDWCIWDACCCVDVLIDSWLLVLFEMN